MRWGYCLPVRFVTRLDVVARTTGHAAVVSDDGVRRRTLTTPNRDEDVYRAMVRAFHCPGQTRGLPAHASCPAPRFTAQQVVEEAYLQDLHDGRERELRRRRLADEPPAARTRARATPTPASAPRGHLRLDLREQRLGDTPEDVARDVLHAVEPADQRGAPAREPADGAVARPDEAREPQRGARRVRVLVRENRVDARPYRGLGRMPALAGHAAPARDVREQRAGRALVRLRALYPATRRDGIGARGPGVRTGSRTARAARRRRA
jgi:hypothetical protein